MDGQESQQERQDPLDKTVSNSEVGRPKGRNGGNGEPPGPEKKRLWREWTSLERTQVVFNGALILFTCVYAGVSIWQACITQKGARAAQRAAKAAEATLTATQESSRLDQRAWVGVIESFRPDIKVGAKPTLGVTIMNSGKTPARLGATHVSARSFAKDKAFVPIYPPKQNSRIALLQPGMRMDFAKPTVREFTQADIDVFRNGDQVMYVYGKFSYRDIFGRGYCTVFCMFYEPDFSVAHACSTYNDETDGECPEENTQ
jgi:hypothetical protein